MKFHSINQRDSKKTILPVPIGLFSQGNMLFILYGILTLTLCGGDAFHLVPRIIRAVRGSNDKIKRQLVYYNDSILHYSDVYLAIHILQNQNAGSD